jgi:hypothetical protein
MTVGVPEMKQTIENMDEQPADMREVRRSECEKHDMARGTAAV